MSDELSGMETSLALTFVRGGKGVFAPSLNLAA